MPASDYNKLIPTPTDQLNISQNDLLLNFGAISDLIDVDHVDFASADAGKHAKITFPPQNPTPVFGPTDIGLYAFLYPTTNTNELYFNSIAGLDTPFTAGILSTNAAPGNNVPGWTWLPSGVLLKWGNSTATGSTTVNFPVAANIPVFTNVMSVIITTTGAGTDIFAQLTSFTATGVVVYGSQRTAVAAAATTFQYLAIGY